MKTLNVTFTDAEFRKLKKAKDKRKGGLSWHGFFISMLTKGVSEKR